MITKLKSDMPIEIYKKGPASKKLSASLLSYLNQKLYNKHNKFVKV
jgi:hypothetical protein